MPELPADIAVLVGRWLAAIRAGMTELDHKLEEFAQTGLTDVSPDGDMVPGVYRIQRVFASGYERHVLLLVCIDEKGYWSMHYDESGLQKGVFYVPFLCP